MWAGVVFVLLAGVPACRGAGYSAYQYYESGGERDAEFYDNYNDDVHRVTTTMTTDAGANNRIKRYGDLAVRTQSPKKMHDVKGALNKILYGNRLESELTHPDHQEYTDIYDYVNKAESQGRNGRNNSGDQFRSKIQKLSTSELGKGPSSVHFQQHWSPHIGVQKWSPVPDSEGTLQVSSSTYSPKEAELQTLISPADTPRTWSPTFDIREPTATEQNWMSSDDLTQDTPETRTYSNEEIKEEIKKLLPQGALPQEWTSTIAVQHWSPSSTITVQRWSAENYYEETLAITMSEQTVVNKQVTEQDIQVTRQDIQALRPKYIGKSDEPHYMRYFRNKQKFSKTTTPPQETTTTTTEKTTTPSAPTTTTSPDSRESTTTSTTSPRTTTPTPTSPDSRESTTTSTTSPRTTTPTATTTSPDSRESTTTSTTSPRTTTPTTTSPDSGESTTTTTRVTTTTSGTTTVGTSPNYTTTPRETTTRSPQMDINAIIAIIANLTYDYDWNLTEQFNKTLIDHGVPTCPTPSTPTTTTTTPPQYDFANTSVVGKCFVCGLKTVEIPRNAYCADAFAGDFLPLVPVDPRARGKIASFRKYCRHLDVHNFVENPSEPRSIYGRFTGGCGVRWTDLSGVYTQRTCRSRFRPLTGKHFGSKRMAKLELALINVENGCIISPMATLLPLSRGISLYARFHACVCTGSWCNRAVRMRHTTPAPVAIALLLCYTNYIR